MMAATLAKGETGIRNAAREPEIADIQAFLNSMGECFEAAGTPGIRIRGVGELGSADFAGMPDRSEAGTYLLAFLSTGGEGCVWGGCPDHFCPLLNAGRSMVG